MDDKFTADQWQNAEVLAAKVISEARHSARIATEMLRTWNKSQIFDILQRDVEKAFSIGYKRN